MYQGELVEAAKKRKADQAEEGNNDPVPKKAAIPGVGSRLQWPRPSRAPQNNPARGLAVVLSLRSVTSRAQFKSKSKASCECDLQCQCFRSPGEGRCGQ